MEQKNKLLFGLLVFSLLIGGCTSEVIEENQNNLEASSDEKLDTNLGDLEQLEQELNELDNLNLDDLDF